AKIVKHVILGACRSRVIGDYEPDNGSQRREREEPEIGALADCAGDAVAEACAGDEKMDGNERDSRHHEHRHGLFLVSKFRGASPYSVACDENCDEHHLLSRAMTRSCPLSAARTRGYSDSNRAKQTPSKERQSP